MTAETIPEPLTPDAWRDLEGSGASGSQACTRCGRHEALGSYCTFCGSAEYDLIVHIDGEVSGCPVKATDRSKLAVRAGARPGRVLGVIRHPGRPQAATTARVAS